MKVLDCTLRDGGNLNEWNFSRQTITKVVGELSASGIDFIEVGYFGGVGKLAKNPGLTANCDRQFLSMLSGSLARLSVLIVPDNQPDLKQLISLPVDLVRIAVYPWEFEKALPCAEYLASHDMATSINLMATSYVQPTEVACLAHRARQAGCQIFYVVDSFGSLLPEQVEEYISVVKSEGSQVGFHGHDNLGLALANCLSALRAGAEFLDAALCGMARGAGNVALEKLIAVLFQLGWSYDAWRIAKLADSEIAQLIPTRADARLTDIGCGICNINSLLLKPLKEVSAKYGIPIEELIKESGELKPKETGYTLVEKIARNWREKNLCQIY